MNRAFLQLISSDINISHRDLKELVAQYNCVNNANGKHHEPLCRRVAPFLRWYLIFLSVLLPTCCPGCTDGFLWFHLVQNASQTKEKKRYDNDNDAFALRWSYISSVQRAWPLFCTMVISIARFERSKQGTLTRRVIQACFCIED